MAGDDHETPFVARLGQDGRDEVSRAGIETGEWLVDEEDGGISREASSQGDPPEVA